MPSVGGGLQRAFCIMGDHPSMSHPEATPMNSTSQTAQERRPANLAALHQRLREMAAGTKSSVPTPKPVVFQEPVLVVRGK